jgi:hypothetical protein
MVSNALQLLCSRLNGKVATITLAFRTAPAASSADGSAENFLSVVYRVPAGARIVCMLLILRRILRVISLGNHRSDFLFVLDILLA